MRTLDLNNHFSHNKTFLNYKESYCLNIEKIMGAHDADILTPLNFENEDLHDLF